MAKELRAARYIAKAKGDPDPKTGKPTRNPEPNVDMYIEAFTNELPYLDYDETLSWYKAHSESMGRYTCALLGCNDRYWLLVELLNRVDMMHPWAFDRCREVEAQPDGHIDLWARGHFKSSIITTGGIIQEVLVDPEITIGIFSVIKPTAVEFLGQIKTEFETNERLLGIYKDVLYPNPRSRIGDHPSKWSLARGINVIRIGRPKEATVEAHGLIDGQPTGRHFKMHVYDDVVTQDNLTDEQLKKTTARFEMADNLGSLHGVRKWIAGTRYHFADAYGVMIEKGSAKPRIYPATIDGTLASTRTLRDGTTVSNLVLLSQEDWERKKRDQGLKTINAQMLLDPIAGSERSFRPEWLVSYEVVPRILNIYILVDPSKGSGERSDRTAIAVIGIDPGGVKYLLDGACHRMKLTERLQLVEGFKKYWENIPGVQTVKVGWERYGKDVELEVVEDILIAKDNNFPIEELNTPRQGGHSKNDRIERMEPDIRAGRFQLPCIVFHADFGAKRIKDLDPRLNGLCYWSVWNDEDQKNAERLGEKPHHHIGQIVYRVARGLTKLQQEYVGTRYRIVTALKRKNESNDFYDLTRLFMEELIRHPFAAHDDLIDACSRIYDIDPKSPTMVDAKSTESIDVDNSGIDSSLEGGPSFDD